MKSRINGEITLTQKTTYTMHQTVSWMVQCIVFVFVNKKETRGAKVVMENDRGGPNLDFFADISR